MKFTEGWKFPRAARKAHYYVADPIRSLCGRWGSASWDDRPGSVPSGKQECCKRCLKRGAKWGDGE